MPTECCAWLAPLQLTTLDPALVRDLNQMFLVRQVFAGLMRFDDDLQPVPAIAESYDVSEDGLVYTFHLDPSARFYDGRQIVAADVVYSFDRAFDPAIAGGNAAALGAPTFLADIEGAADRLNGGADLLTGVVALDEQTVRVTLSQPRSTFLMRLASPRLRLWTRRICHSASGGGNRRMPQVRSGLPVFPTRVSR
ncbi:MAG: ABC transporter substrate-binding protein [Thermomicrobiales bacterium]